MTRPQRAAVCTAVITTLAWMALSPSAGASYPGKNGAIAFTREGPPFSRSGEGARTIWAVNPRTKRTRRLTRVPRRCRRGWTWADLDPSYSPSGRRLVYHHFDSCDPRTPDGLYVMRADGSGRRLIKRATFEEFHEFPAFLPSGRHVSYSEQFEESYVFSIPRPGDRPVGKCPEDSRCSELTFPPGRTTDTSHPAWSSKGALALTLSAEAPSDALTETGHLGIVTLSSRGARAEYRLATRSRRDAVADWSPNGRRLVFHREKDTRRGVTARRLFADVLATVAFGSRRPRRLTETRDAFFPAWSPDGRQIAYVRGIWSRPGALWLMRARDGRSKRLLLRGVLTSHVSWQPRPRR